MNSIQIYKLWLADVMDSIATRAIRTIILLGIPLSTLLHNIILCAEINCMHGGRLIYS